MKGSNGLIPENELSHDYFSIWQDLIFLKTKNNCIMKKNMGNLDRITRIMLAVVFAALYFTEITTGTIGLVLVIIGGVFLATSFISFCPLYTIVGINTCPKDEE